MPAAIRVKRHQSYTFKMVITVANSNHVYTFPPSSDNIVICGVSLGRRPCYGYDTIILTFSNKPGD